MGAMPTLVVGMYEDTGKQDMPPTSVGMAPISVGMAPIGNHLPQPPALKWQTNRESNIAM